jgi:hypothetical protein
MEGQGGFLMSGDHLRGDPEGGKGIADAVHELLGVARIA